MWKKTLGITAALMIGGVRLGAGEAVHGRCGATLSQRGAGRRRAESACLKSHKDELSPACKKEKVMQMKIKQEEQKQLQEQQQGAQPPAGEGAPSRSRSLDVELLGDLDDRLGVVQVERGAGAGTPSPTSPAPPWCWESRASAAENSAMILRSSSLTWPSA